MRKAFTIILLFSLLIVLCLHPKWYLKNGQWKPDSAVSAKLSQLGDSALNTLDVPVAAVLVYNNVIIGEGWNTVRRNSMAGGHAEINAISDAMRKTGVDSFMKLDREHLTLITTLEPCSMCEGAIVEYNIRHVIIMKSKSMYHWFKQWKKLARYEWNKQVATTDSLQDALFKKHPDYNEQKMKSNF